MNIQDLLNDIDILYQRKTNVNNLLKSLQSDDEALKELLRDKPEEITDSLYLVKISKDAINVDNQYIYNYFSHEYDVMPGVNNKTHTFASLRETDKTVNIKKYCGVWFTLNINATFHYLDKKLKKMRSFIEGWGKSKLWDDNFNPSIGFFHLKSDIPNMLLINCWDTQYNINILEEIMNNLKINKEKVFGEDYDILKNNYLSGDHPNTNYYYAAIICRIPQINGWINLADSDEIYIKNPSSYVELKSKFTITKIHNIKSQESKNVLLSKGNPIKWIDEVDGYSIMTKNIVLYNNSGENFYDEYIKVGNRDKVLCTTDLSREKNIIQFGDCIECSDFVTPDNYIYNKQNLLKYMKDNLKTYIRDDKSTEILDNDLFDSNRQLVQLDPDVESNALKNMLPNETYDKLKDDLKVNSKLHELLVEIYKELYK